MRVRLADGLTAPARVAGLGFEDDAHALDVGGHVHPPATLAHLGIGGDVVLAQQPSQLAVQQVLVLAGHAAPRRAARARAQRYTRTAPERKFCARAGPSVVRDLEYARKVDREKVDEYC